MRCAACHRTLLTPAYTAPTRMGGWVLEGQLSLFEPVTAPALARAHNL